MISGPRVDLSKFKAGWLLMPAGGRAHLFTRTDGAMKAACGRTFGPLWRDSKGFVAFEPGSYRLCARCR